jgi:hypothetical protein
MKGHVRSLAQPGHAKAARRCLLVRVERTCRSSAATSVFDPERTFPARVVTGLSHAKTPRVC